MKVPSHMKASDLRPKFTQSWKDWEYLEAQRNLNDQVEEVDWYDGTLLKYPCKEVATQLLHQRIDTWFDEMGDGDKIDRRTKAIAYRHLYDLEGE